MRSLSMIVMTGVLAIAVRATAGGPDISSSEYGYYMDWKEGREDPRLSKDDDGTRLKKIAKTLGLRPDDLRRIVDKVDPVAGTLETQTEQAIRAALDGTPLKGRVLLADVNATTGHVVAWVQWQCGDERDIDKEAAYAGWAVADSGKAVRTLVAYCTVNDSAGGETKLFSAKAADTSITRIAKDGIERFSSSRYIKLFEEVKRGPHK